MTQSHKQPLTQMTQRLIQAQKRSRIVRWTVLLAIAVGLTACGGGGSSSGGGGSFDDLFPDVPTGKFTGTYSNRSYSGTIEVTINSESNVVISMTGIPCLASPFSEGMVARVSGDILAIGGDILGVPNSNIGIVPNININVPVTLGAGTFDLDPPAPCLSQVDGQITLN